MVSAIKEICKEVRFYEELETLINKNVWINHFESVQIKSGWVDFEQEISKIIQVLDQIRVKVDQEWRDKESRYNLSSYEINILRSVISGVSFNLDAQMVENIKNQLLIDLYRLTRCLEIYLSEYVNEIQVTNKLACIEKLSIQKVLSFNYTNTFKRIYTNGDLKEIEYDYIHGIASSENNINTCNLIIGIDEYLDDDRKDSDNEFIQFKKFYQRIYKRTGNKYLTWIEEREDEITWLNSPKFNIYIYGHSLDVTDKDILRRMIMAPEATITIFYHNQEAFGKQIMNMVKLIGQDELISRTGGSNPSIFFVNALEVELSK